MYHCCIFDLDGTLLNTIYALTYTVNRVLEKYGLNPLNTDQMQHFVGNGYKKQIERSLICAGDTDLVYYEDALLTYTEEFAKYCMYRVKPYEGIREMLDFLKSKSVKLAVFSNKPDARTKENIEGIFGIGYFDAIVGEKAGIPKKPDPAGAFLLMRELCVTPSECLYFGDTNTDMETGIAAGMDMVGVTWGFRDRTELEAYHPKYLIDIPGEVMSRIWKH